MFPGVAEVATKNLEVVNCLFAVSWSPFARRPSLTFHTNEPCPKATRVERGKDSLHFTLHPCHLSSKRVLQTREGRIREIRLQPRKLGPSPTRTLHRSLRFCPQNRSRLHLSLNRRDSSSLHTLFLSPSFPTTLPFKTRAKDKCTTRDPWKFSHGPLCCRIYPSKVPLPPNSCDEGSCYCTCRPSKL